MTTATTWLLIAVGVIAVLGAKVLAGDAVQPGIVSAVLETLGITVATVLTVKLIYERFIAEEHFRKFMNLLKSELGNFQNLTGMSLRLGIREEYSTRLTYADHYSVDQIIDAAPNGSTFRCIGRSLFHVTNRTDVLEQAYGKGLTIELCFLDTEKHSDLIEKLTGTYTDDIRASIRSVNDLVSKIVSSKDGGSLEVRTHGVLLYDSFTSFCDREGVDTIAWDLSFGRDLKHKRVFVLDAIKPLGVDLARRYDALWQHSESQVLVGNGVIKHNNWAQANSGVQPTPTSGRG